jgi:hypothetical protein
VTGTFSARLDGGIRSRTAFNALKGKLCMYVLTECCNAFVKVATVDTASLVIVLQCSRCQQYVGSPGIEDIRD